MSREMNLPNSESVVETLKALRRYRGLYSRVAYKLGVHPSLVSRVASGERPSKRIEEALNAELRKLGKRSPT